MSLDQHHDQLAMGGVVGPALAVAQGPLAVMDVGVGHRPQQPLVERLQVRVGRLLGPAGEEDGDVRAVAVELAVVVEARALQRRHHDRGGARLFAAPNVAAARGSSWFSMNRMRRS